MYFDVEKKSQNKLSREVWKFCFAVGDLSCENMIRLEYYMKQSRRTIKCKWVTDKGYYSKNWTVSEIEAENVKFPKKIKIELKKAVLAIIEDIEINKFSVKQNKFIKM